MAEIKQSRHLLVNGGSHYTEDQAVSPKHVARQKGLTNGSVPDDQVSLDYIKDIKDYEATKKARPDPLPPFAAIRGSSHLPRIKQGESSAAAPTAAPAEAKEDIPRVSIIPPEGTDPPQEVHPSEAIHPSDEIDHGTEIEVTRQLDSGPLTEGSSTTVHDYGISEQLKLAPVKVLAQETQDHLVVQTGKAFLQDQTAKPPSVLGDIDLAEVLRNEKIQHPHEERGYFIPIDSLTRVITHDSVTDELQRLREHSSHVMDDALCADIAEFVCNKHEIQPKPGEKTKYTSGSKLFAILVLIDKSREIQRFIAEGLTDTDLPFKIVHTGGNSRLVRKDSTDNYIKSFDGWKTFEIESFEAYQWYLLSPFFSSNSSHYHFETKTLLPFTESEERYHSDDQIGGYGAVFKVRIHTAHHSFDRGKSDNPYYAVKRLISHDEFAFRHEVEILKKFSNRPHENLIRLLATYQHANSHYLIFPWADGNLRQFWERNPKPKLDRHVAVWMARQCLGLVFGLSKIHNYQSSTSDSINLPTTSPSVRGKPYGRHSDIKPENILWFKDSDSSSDSSAEISGILKISDFGFTQFNSKQSRSRIPNKHMPRTPTYRPPECDLPQDQISQSYDIWTLGCLYLEFVVWLLKGFHAVNETFPDDRLRDDINTQYPDLKEDTFFNIDETGTYLKSTVVKWINYLHADENCTAYLHDLLDLTLKFLLHPNPKKRAKCFDVVKLQGMEEKCRGEESYCLDGFSRITESTPPTPYLGMHKGEEMPTQRILDGRAPLSTSPRHSLDYPRSNLPRRDSKVLVGEVRPRSPLRKVTTNPQETDAVLAGLGLKGVAGEALTTAVEKGSPATEASTTPIQPDTNDKTFNFQNLARPALWRPQSPRTIPEKPPEALKEDDVPKVTRNEGPPVPLGSEHTTRERPVSKNEGIEAIIENKKQEVKKQRQSPFRGMTARVRQVLCP